MAQSYTTQYGQLYTQGVNQFRSSYNAITYGALILPFSDALGEGEGKDKSLVKKANSLKGKLKTAFSEATTIVKDNISHPTQLIKELSNYVEENSQMISEVSTGVSSFVGDKLSGIAVAQAIMDGQVTSQEALDYLFLGFAPALGVTASALGYSGLSEMKDALKGGSINVGQFVNGFTTALKGAKQIKDQVLGKETKTRGDVIQFDLTLGHNETYTSETPDRRVQNGQSLQEFIHNLPETFDLNCALQEGKRYGKSELREIFKVIRNRKEPVFLILGEEMFFPVILTNFSPSSDCTKSGFDYTLSFKQLYQNNITTDKEVTIQKIPQDLLIKSMESSNSIDSGSNVGNLGGKGTFNIDTSKVDKEIADSAKKMGVTLDDIKNPPLLSEIVNNKSTLKILRQQFPGG